MNTRSTTALSIVLVVLSMISILDSPSNVAAVSIPDPPVVGIWSNSCISFVISSNNTSCGNLSPGHTISVQVNITNAPAGTVNGYDMFLYYDPAFLTATSVDQTTGTVFTNILTSGGDLTVPGQVRAHAVSQGFNTIPNGVLFSISFSIVKNGVSPISIAQGLVPGFAQSYTELTTPSPLAPATADGYFINVAGNPGPVAKFTFSAKVTAGGRAIFDATASYDPDASPPGTTNNGIASYIWDFGGASALSGPTTNPVNTITLGSVTGNFSVRLTVVDSDNNLGIVGNYFQGMLTQLFTITKKPLHDLVAQTVTPTPKIANAGDKVAVNVIIANNGTFFEDFKLSLSYSPPSTIIGTKSNESISLGAASSEGFTWDTTGLSPGFYTLTANVTIIPSISYNPAGFENITSNNVAATQVQILGASSSVSPLLLVAGGTAAGVVALAVVGLLLRRRRRATASR